MIATSITWPSSIWNVSGVVAHTCSSGSGEFNRRTLLLYSSGWEEMSGNHGDFRLHICTFFTLARYQNRLEWLQDVGPVKQGMWHGTRVIIPAQYSQWESWGAFYEVTVTVLTLGQGYCSHLLRTFFNLRSHSEWQNISLGDTERHFLRQTKISTTKCISNVMYSIKCKFKSTEF